MFTRLEWHVQLPPGQVLARLDDTLIGEDALRQRMTDALEAKLTEWRQAQRPMGRVKGNRFRMFLARESLRNIMAPVLRGRVRATPEGSRITARVGASWTARIALGILTAIWLMIAVAWIVIRVKSGERNIPYLLLGPVFQPEVLVLILIFASLRWAARKDVHACARFIEEQFKDHITLPDDAGDKGQFKL